MMKKLVSILIIIGFIFSYFGCEVGDGEDGLSQELKEYSFAILVLCSLAAGLGAPGTSTIIVDITTTYTFTDFPYADPEPAVVNGSFDETDDGITYTDVGSLVFTDDPEGLNTMDLDFVGDSGGDITGGVITINGTDVPATEFQDWLDGIGP